MSTAHAYAPAAPHLQPQAVPRHVRIVTTRAQRRARPKALYALVTVIGLFAIFMAQLLLSIVLSDGAYQISALQSQTRSLSQDEQALAERLALLGSQQNLAASAESMGMVVSSTPPVFLRLSDGAVIGSAAANGTGSAIVGATGSLVPNILLGTLPPVDLAVSSGIAGSQVVNGAVPGEPETSAGSQAVASPSGPLPSPVTR